MRHCHMGHSGCISNIAVLKKYNAAILFMNLLVQVATVPI